MPLNEFPARLAPDAGASPRQREPRRAISSQRAIAAEIPVSFVYGDAPYAVMMASPGDLEDFAYGFSLTEGLVRSTDEIRSVKATPQAERACPSRSNSRRGVSANIWRGGAR